LNIILCDKEGYAITNFKKNELNDKVGEETVLIDVGTDNNISKINAKNVLLNIIVDVENLNDKQKEKVIRNIIKIRNSCKRKNIKFGIELNDKIVIANFSNELTESYKNNEIFVALNVLLYDNIGEKYNYLYGKLCDYLDDKFYNNNLCEFRDNVCLAKRNNGAVMGCCHYYKNKYLGVFLPSKFVLCKYNKDGKCTIRCLQCKLFTCDELRKKGIKYTVNNVVLIKVFFNLLQKLIIRISIFTPQEQVVKRLLMTR